MSVFITLLAIIAVLIVAILLYAATRPATFRIERATTVIAPADRIFPLIDDFRQWAAWSPYETMDPELKRSFSGAESGKGAVYAWEGRKAGAGPMEIVDTAPPSRVVVKLDFLKPFKASNTAEYTLEPVGDGTRVTWAMHGPNLFIGKIMGLFMSMDRMIGRDFEAGLAKLKSIAEA